MVKSLEHEMIFNIDLNGDIRNSLCIIFDKVAGCCRIRRFESTDASKLLHAILPNLFVMWDDKIKKGLIGFRNSGREYDGRCYAYEFLPSMQKSAKQFLDSYIQENGKDYDNASKQISQLSEGYTLAKLIDELNYITFTKKKTLEEIRGMPL